MRALVLTHAHFDHVGSAERMRRELGVPVYVHVNDAPITRHPWRYDHERARTPYLLSQPKALPIVASFLRERAFWPRPIGAVTRYDDGELPVPGRPKVVFTPGHCALHLPDRDALIAGDAVVMLDPLHRPHRPAHRRARRHGGRRAQPGAPGCAGGDRRADDPDRPRRAVDRRRRGDCRRDARCPGGLSG